MATTTDLTTLKINYLTQAQYDAALAAGTINSNEIYFTPNTMGDLIVSSEEASNPTSYPTNSIWLKYGSAAGGQADWIIEQTTSGIWTYRKWNSGIAECWGKENNTSVSLSAWGSTGLYSGNLGSVSWPSELFIEAPLIYITLGVTGGNGWLTRNTGANASVSGTRYVISPNSSLSAVNVHTYCIGKWKAM